MKMLENKVLLGLCCLAVALFVGAGSVSAQATLTPTEYTITLYEVELSTDGSTFVTVFENTSGLAVDLADPASFASAFADGVVIGAGEYSWIRMTIDTDLEWSHPDPPVSLSDQIFTVTGGPPGPAPGQMTVYFATQEEGGRPGGRGGGAGTLADPLLLGTAANVAAGSSTTLRMIFRVTDALEDQGGSVYDLGPPVMFFVSENDEPSTLAGTFNTVVYNVTKEFDELDDVEEWDYMSGHGTLIFDGAGSWTWSGTTNDFDLQGGATGALDGAASFSGKYGVNADGSFWMLVTGEPGTLQGAVSSDGTMLVATMYDSESSHLMMFGVEQASSASVATMDTGYYFTTYSSSWNAGATRLEYRNSFGVVNGDGLGGITGTDDSNEIRITDPTGTAIVNAPTFSLGDGIVDTLSVNPIGTMSNGSTDLAGGILENGDAACIAWNFDTVYTPTNQFGFLVRQSTAGTFTNASLAGTYFGAFFGDVYDGSDSEYFSGFFNVTFSGGGLAVITLVENREGVISEDSFTQNYSVDTNTGIVTFSDIGGPADASLKGAIGPDGMSFILASEVEESGAANDQRFLGLGLKQ